MLFEQLPYQTGRVIDERGDLVVRHARGAHHADDAAERAEAIRRRDERECRQPRVGVLLADRDRQPLAAAGGQGVAQQVAPLRDVEQTLELRARRELGLARQSLSTAKMYGTRLGHRNIEQLLGFLDEDVEQLRRAGL